MELKGKRERPAKRRESNAANQQIYSEPLNCKKMSLMPQQVGKVSQQYEPNSHSKMRAKLGNLLTEFYRINFLLSQFYVVV